MFTSCSQNTRFIKPQLLTAILAVTIVGLTGASASGQSFSDQTPSGLDGTGSAAWGDYNNDGYPDLLSNSDLLRNNQNGTFTAVDPGDSPNQAIFGDYDNDGSLDIYSMKRREALSNEGGGRFDVQDTLVPEYDNSEGEPRSSQSASFADHNNDGDLDIYVGGYDDIDGYVPDRALLNNGASGFSVSYTQSSDIRPARGVTTADYDRDGDSDIYVSNYREEANMLMENDGTGQFTDVAQDRGVAGDDSGTGTGYGQTIGSAWGDLNNDGLQDLFVSNLDHPPSIDTNHDQRKFYRNLGSDQDFDFADEGAGGVAYQESYASPAFADYDNDNDLDLFLTTIYNTASGGVENHPVLYRNDGNFNFTDVTAQAGLDGLSDTYQAAWADYDRDGDQDLVTDGKLFENSLDNDHHWLELALEADGEQINTDAIGTQVTIELENGETLLREVRAGTGRGNQNDKTLHFGLGDYEGQSVDLDLLLPGGDTAILNDVSIDRIQNLNLSNIPEPTSLVVLALGGSLLAFHRPRRLG